MGSAEEIAATSDGFRAISGQLIMNVWQLYLLPVASLLVPLTIAVILAAVLVAAIAARPSGQPFGRLLGYILPFGWLGGVCGMVAGNSREPLIGALLTGMLTIVGLLLPYALSKTALASWRPVIPVAIIVLCFAALIGITLGQSARSKWDQYDRTYAEWKTRYEAIDVPLMKVQKQYDICRKNVLPARSAICEPILTR